MIKLNRLFEVIDFKKKQIESGDHFAYQTVVRIK